MQKHTQGRVKKLDLRKRYRKNFNNTLRRQFCNKFEKEIRTETTIVSFGIKFETSNFKEMMEISQM